jgi:hypothetical protein
MLDSHPEIKCLGELMRPTPGWMKQDGYRGALRVLEKVDPVYKDDNYRFDHPYEFVQAVLETAPNRKVYGFKIHVDQHPIFLDQLIADPEWKIVVLERENMLAQYSSWKIAERTGQGNAPKGTKVVRAKVEFSAREFNKFINRKNKEWERFWSGLRTKGKEYFYIRYTDLLSKPVVQNMLGFLDVSPSVDLQPGTEKRNPWDILSRFSNPQEVATELEKMGHLHWTYENV